MINKEILSKIFKSNDINFSINLDKYGNAEIKKKLLNIVIFNNSKYTENITLLNLLKKNCLQRKNCWVLKPNEFYDKTLLFFHENYIQSIIRQKLLNTLLND